MTWLATQMSESLEKSVREDHHCIGYSQISDELPNIFSHDDVL